MDLQEQYEKLLRYCTMLIGDRTDAEDIVQETYLKFWQSHTYRDTNKELAYLYVIARNLCMDRFRRPKTEDIDDYAELQADKQYEPESRIEHMAIEDAMDKLPEELREPVMLRYTNDMQVTDIAKITGMSRFAVHRRLKEGLRMLKEILGGDGYER